jgi:predicted amidophosphoribosyltransferase
MRFFDFLFPPRVDEAVLHGCTDDAFLALLAPRLVLQTRPETVGLFPFPDPRVRAVLHEAKYHGSERAFKLLGAALADYLRDCDDLGKKVCIVPVPLGTKRLKERGFNQVREVVRRAVQDAGIEIEDSLLLRTRETVSQVSLPREKREENMRGAFIADHPADPAYTYIVVDDVITTGATLQATIDALKTAGATHIIPIALAH